MKKDYLYRIFGGILILIFLFLTFFEYDRILHPASEFIANGKYIDYSILLYSSRWIIYFLLFLAGFFTFLKSKKSYLILLIFSLTALLEIYINEVFYIVKSLSGYPKYFLLGSSIMSIVVIAINALKTKKISFIDFFLSSILAILIVYLPNTLITYYF